MPARNNQQLKPRDRRTTGATSAAKHDAPHQWTFLTNHAHVLILLYSEPDLVLREVAAKVGITERAVQRIVQELEQGGVLKREKIGRRNRYRIAADQHLRHPIESHCTVKDLLALVVSPAAKKQSSAPTRGAKGEAKQQ